MTRDEATEEGRLRLRGFIITAPCDGQVGAVVELPEVATTPMTDGVSEAVAGQLADPSPKVAALADVHDLGFRDPFGGQLINVDGGHGLRRGPDMSAMLEPLFGADGLRGVVSN